MEPGRDVVPWLNLFAGSVASCIPIYVEPLSGHRLNPTIHFEVLAPLLEHSATAPDALNNFSDAPVAAAIDPLNHGGLRVVPREFDATFTSCVSKHPNLAL